jgi:glycosyltransferase involved in cell wall biosynthesis
VSDGRHAAVGAEAQRAKAAYERAREAVLKMIGGAAGGPVAPSEYWREELETIDYLIEATPLIINKLRHHAFHITGIRPYDYRSKGDNRREYFEARLNALRELGGDRLLVPESPALGGFGYDIDGRLFNVDTLKFYEVLVGMERGGVLAALRLREQPVVCEIGAGWGGFAYQFKTLFPKSTYVIVDFPELFLFSMTYLATVFPEARLAVVGAGDAPADVRDADFVFVPQARANGETIGQLDLLVNMVSFQEMTDAQVRRYADIAAMAGCPLVYSFNRERSAYNTELISVSEALAERYQLTEVPVLQTDYTNAMKRMPKPGKVQERSEFNYRHLVGRLDPSATVVGPVLSAFAKATADRRSSSSGGWSDGPSIGRSQRTGPTGSGGVVLGMTLYNNAQHLPEALDSLLAQTHGDFTLILLDDASVDDTESVARGYASRDARVKYFRHDSRQAMIATWRDVVQIAMRECPSAQYFAWVSDHDRWHPRWLERLRGELERDPEAVIAYPITRRIGQTGAELDKGPRLFDTTGCADLRARWRHMCHAAVAAGDMVYGLMRVSALMKAGIFRRVLRPDRLLVAELVLVGGVRQVPEALWFRRESNGASVERQRHTLLLAGDEPKWFHTPPWFQHSVMLWEQYATPEPPPLSISRPAWARMLLLYSLTYGWKHLRKTEASHAVGRGIDNAIWVKKSTKHHWHHAVYNILVGGRAVWGRTRRLARRGVYEVLMLTHRLGLRGRGKAPTR